MEDPLPQSATPGIIVNEISKDSESAENFQKFIFDLFDKNGILNDLRAYLRGHIVNVLRSAQTGEPPTCQKHFTQRLDLTFQALNILVAEYLLRLEFSYSFSVFISEIPLSNMVFEFAKTLMQNGNSEKLGLRFKDRDVWSILNHLGVKCDSNHASSILEMYRSHECHPLLLCILKNIPMYDEEEVYINNANSSKNSVSSSLSSSESLVDNTTKDSRRKPSSLDKCRHYTSCSTCQKKIARVKEKYTRAKKNFAKNIKDTKVNPKNVESLLKNVNVMERRLLDETFQQMEKVYEAEVEIMREEQQKKVRRCLANQAMLLQRSHDEMEMTLKDREAELERNVQQKKKFLWGLARALRDQHGHMTRAMHDVRQQTNRLTDKEERLKTQLAEAEQTLRRRAEEMRSQISNELTTLETHQESMRIERESIKREKSELEHLKKLWDSRKREEYTKIDNIDIDGPRRDYELSILKKCVESMESEPKCLIERSTMTDLSDVTAKLTIVLNNGRDADNNKISDEIRHGNGQLVNDLKKQKNVNFSQSNLDEIYRERGRERCHSSTSSEAGDSALDKASPHQRDVLVQIRQENERLKAFIAQQREHIDALSRQQARLQAELVAERFRPNREPYQLPLRPGTAPAFVPEPNYFLHSVSASANAVNYGWRKGAGEEVGHFSNTQPRIYQPGDSVPFIGVLNERRNDARRHLINQWRMLRRTSPVRVVGKNRASPGGRVVIEKPVNARPNLNTDIPTHEQDAKANIEILKDVYRQTDTRCESQQRGPKTPLIVTIDVNKNKFKNKDNSKTHIQSTVREKSPNAVLREAKLRLRKLEIEAEAVEKSYMDFRTRQCQLRGEKLCLNSVNEDSVVGHDKRVTDLHRTLPVQKLYIPREVNKINQYKDLEKTIKIDFDKYFRQYTTVSNLEAKHFRNRNSISLENTKPIAETYSEIDGKDKIYDYLETPLSEFRKLYSQPGRLRSPKREAIIKEISTDCTRSKISSTKKSSQDDVEEEEEDKRIEQEIENDNNSVNATVEDDDEEEDKRIEQEIENDNNSVNATAEDDEEEEDKRIEQEIENDNNSVNTTVERDNELIVETGIEENLLRVEVESVNAVSGIKMTESQTGDILLVVGSCSSDNADEMKSASQEDGEEISARMTIIVSPKRNTPLGPNSTNEPDTPALEQAVPLTSSDVLDDIFRPDDNNIIISNDQMQLDSSGEIPKEDVIGEEEEKGKLDEEYPDDFSADVDNYNIQSDYEINSPISLPKTSEDDNFWDL